jgi:hypothetical protein
MKGPELLVEHLRTEQYHPRSDAHSNAICMGILQDLLTHCPPLADRARSGELVAKVNHTVTINYQRWNIDLALGPPAGAPVRPSGDQLITEAIPSVIEVAIEAKGVMTEHGKARHNRLRDLQAFHSHAHAYNDKVVAVGVVVVNVSPFFWSPTRQVHDVTLHHNIDQLGPETVNLFRNLPLRHVPGDGPGLEAAGVIVVKHDNLRKNEHLPDTAPLPEDTVLVNGRPAPQVGDPLHYSTMIRRICRAYTDRWVHGSNASAAR